MQRLRSSLRRSPPNRRRLSPRASARSIATSRWASSPRMRSRARSSRATPRARKGARGWTPSWRSGNPTGSRMAGRYFEDFKVGETYKHWPGRTITATDNTWFTLLTMNQHPLHFDEEYARHTEFGKPLVNSALTLAIVAGMSVADVSQKAIANLGWTDIR